MNITRRRIHVRSDTGQTAVEFALVAPLLIALLLGIVQAGIAFHNYLSVTDAARAVARKAILVRLSTVTQSDLDTIAHNAAADLDPGQMNVTLTPDPADPTFNRSGSTVTVTVTYPYHVSILGLPLAEGNLTSTMKDRLE